MNYPPRMTGKKHCPGKSHPKGGEHVRVLAFAQCRHHRDGLATQCRDCAELGYQERLKARRWSRRARGSAKAIAAWS